MPKILVVDDSAVARRLAGGLLESSLKGNEQTGAVQVVYAVNGREALASMQEELPDLVLTDLQMPEMDGLQLVEEVRGRYPGIPVVLMTAHGSEEVAVLALKRGAASYVPKRNIARDLVDTVRSILAVTHEGRAEQRLFQCMVRSESDFVLDSDPDLVPPLVRYMQDAVKKTRLCDASGALQLTIALWEALANAIEHGNLEAKSEIKDTDEGAFRQLVADRRTQRPYCDRKVHITTRQTPAEVVYVIRDEGPGFSPGSIPDPTDPANLERAHGRGLLLIRTFMDDVQHNQTGNEITLVKRRSE